ncbi:MAG: hypothetical protein IKU15_07870 [Clostridia bacterium]|nr:hypothetical protein [Clostridia bacterium]
MIEITVKLQLDENSSDAKSALAALFGLPNFSSCYCAGVSAEKPDPQPEVKAEEVKPTPQPEPEKAEQKAEDPKPAAAAKKYKTEDVRAAMASKLADHRVDLVNKLKDMGAKNVSSLPEDKYEEFINFCNSL